MVPVAAGKTALITGVTGQDGYYLSQALVRDGVTVHGLVPPDGHATDAPRGVTAHLVDLADPAAMLPMLGAVQPDYVFHLAAQSSVGQSWQDPVSTMKVNALITTVLLDSCSRVQESAGKAITVVNASSGEIFAGATDSPQHEDTRISPTSPYGAAKAAAHMMCGVYRHRGLAAANAILYNHESPRRQPIFVTRKITRTVARIALSLEQHLTLGDITIRRDWGWAPDYVDAMIRMALHGEGDDFVIATGTAHSIAEFVEAAFAAAGITDWQPYVRHDPALLRPGDSLEMVGDSSKAWSVLGWKPTVSFDEIAASMVRSDLEQERRS